MTENEKLKKLVAQIMAECEKDGEPVTEKEAFEMAKLELKATANNKLYAKSDKEKAKANRTPKIDADKVDLIEYIEKALNMLSPTVENLNIKNVQKEITFSYKGAEYSVNLVKHRPPKS